MKLFKLILLVSGASSFSAVAANELEPALRVLVPGGHLLKLDYFLKLIDVEENGAKLGGGTSRFLNGVSIEIRSKQLLLYCTCSLMSSLGCLTLQREARWSGDTIGTTIARRSWQSSRSQKARHRKRLRLPPCLGRLRSLSDDCLIVAFSVGLYDTFT